MSEWIDILDVSAAQGHIDWPRIAAATVAPGITRAFRGVYVKVSENEAGKDPMRSTNLAGARAAGLLVGAYHFFHPHSDPEKQIRNAWEAIGDTMPSFPLAIDVEAADPSLTPMQIVSAVQRARDAALERFGRLPVIYLYPDFTSRRLQPALAASDLGDCWLWWASYGAGRPWYPPQDRVPAPPPPFSRVAAWQYSGNTAKTTGAWNGRVNGIAGDVDRSVFLLGEDVFRYDFCGEPRT